MKAILTCFLFILLILGIMSYEIISFNKTIIKPRFDITDIVCFKGAPETKFMIYSRQYFYNKKHWLYNMGPSKGHKGLVKEEYIINCE